MTSCLAPYRRALAEAAWTPVLGRVRGLRGLVVEAEGLQAHVGDLCLIRRPGARGEGVPAEVLAAEGSRCTLMPYGSVEGLRSGCDVEAHGGRPDVAVGVELLGRVVDAFGAPLDGRAPARTARRRALHAPPCNPMRRPRIDRFLETGIRAIDVLLSLGQGQRVGIFAGSGVGKSTLLGMMARHVKAEVNVIALIGERGREVRDFIDGQLGAQGLARSVVVVAAADQPAPARVRAAYAAMAIAEQFRDEGRQVLLLMDSVTRFAMARREMGLAAGEPPTARGYTPSVFAELAPLCERCGTADSGGAITALMTVLVEGDDFNEPVSDHLRAILDGHIVLSRQLAQAGHHPAIDLLQSASRVMPDVADAAQRRLAAEALRELALLERNRQLVEIGAYEGGSQPQLDAALAREPRLRQWLCQEEGGAAADAARQQLRALLAWNPPAAAARPGEAHGAA